MMMLPSLICIIFLPVVVLSTILIAPSQLNFTLKDLSWYEETISRNNFVLHKAPGCHFAKPARPHSVVVALLEARRLRFALVLSGQICHGKASTLLSRQAEEVELMLANKRKMIIDPLEKAWGAVDVFGFFEEDKSRRICNELSSFLPWKGLALSPVGAYKHGEERRASAVRLFLGLDGSWEVYDYLITARPDVMFRKPLPEFPTMNLSRVTVAGFETNNAGVIFCDPLRLLRTSDGVLPSFVGPPPRLVSPIPQYPYFD